MLHKKLFYPVYVILLVLALTGCNLPSVPKPTPTEPLFPTSSTLPTVLPVPLTITQAAPTSAPSPTNPAITAAAAPTNAPAKTIPTVVPVFPALAGTRVSMAPGRTSVGVNGSVVSGSKTSYLARAGAGQFMMTMVNSANKALYLEIHTPTGAMLVSPGSKATFWQGTLPIDGDYQISVVSSGGPGDFELDITIPVQVKFSPGAYGSTMNGYIGAHEVNTYLLRALKGQTLSVKITAPNNDIFLTIYGLDDGQPYVRSVTGQSFAAIQLPSNQNYVIQCVSTGNSAENYKVEFTAK
jgi:hypothetical protein